MKIVILDGYTENPGDLSWGELEKLGEFTVYDRTSLTDENETIERIGDAEIVITNKTPITKKVLDSCPGIKYIGVLATGYNIVDVAAAKAAGVAVTNVPAYATRAVAQHVFALTLEIASRVGMHARAVAEGEWTNAKDFCFWNASAICSLEWVVLLTKRRMPSTSF